MSHMAKTKYYAFIDVALDIFVSVILYNLFTTFPGFNAQLLLLVFAVLVIINYWWGTRSYFDLPKHYLIDLYFLAMIMFIFAQWANYLDDLRGFLMVATIFFLTDAVFALSGVFLHAEKKDEPSLYFYAVTEIVVAAVYFAMSRLLVDLTPIAAASVFLPYLLLWGATIRRGYFKFKFEDAGNQPY